MILTYNTPEILYKITQKQQPKLFTKISNKKLSSHTQKTLQ